MVSVTLYPTADADVNDAAPTTNYGSNDRLGIGEDSTSDDTLRSFLLFDLSTIRKGSFIRSASLKLTISTDKSGNVRTKEIYRTDASWVEGTITWNTQPGATGTVLGSLSYGTSDTGEKTFTLNAAEMQKFITGEYTNNGFIIKNLSGENDDLYSHYSRHNATESNRPRLIIEYSPPGGSFIFNLV